VTIGPERDPLWPGFASTAAFDVLGVGQNSLDRVFEGDGPPPAEGEPEPPGAVPSVGGQVATALLACARLGLRCSYAGAVGDDAAGREVLEPLRGAGVDLAGVVRVPGARTRRAFVFVDRRDGERFVTPERDPRCTLEPAQLDPARVASARAVHVDAEHPAASLRAAELARAAGAPVTADLDRPDPAAVEILQCVDFPIVSSRFAETLMENESPWDALAALPAPRARLLVVTLGSQGALARDGATGRIFASPGFRVEVRDTTGAGDVFHAGFLFALLRGTGAQTALRVANAAAAASCRGFGAQGALPDRETVEALLSGPEAV
jgi:sulfofructose kinase